MITYSGSFPTRIAGFIRCAVLLNAEDQLATVASTCLSIFHATLVVTVNTVVTTFVARPHLSTTPAASHRLIPILTGLDFLNVCTTFRFGHTDRRSPDRQTPRSKIDLDIV